MRYALIVGVLIALCSSLLGVTLVLKRFSFIGDGLSPRGVRAMAIAAVLGLTDDMPLTLGVTVCAVLLLRTGQKYEDQGRRRHRHDLGGGAGHRYLLMNLFSTSSNLSGDVCRHCSAPPPSDAVKKRGLAVRDCPWWSWQCSYLFYNKIFAVTFDEDFAKAVGIKADLYNLLIRRHRCRGHCAGDESGRLLLISALVIFPALSAMRLSRISGP